MQTVSERWGCTARLMHMICSILTKMPVAEQQLLARTGAACQQWCNTRDKLPSCFSVQHGTPEPSCAYCVAIASPQDGSGMWCASDFP